MESDLSSLLRPAGHRTPCPQHSEMSSQREDAVFGEAEQGWEWRENRGGSGGKGSQVWAAEGGIRGGAHGSCFNVSSGGGEGIQEM